MMHGSRDRLETVAEIPVATSDTDVGLRFARSRGSSPRPLRIWYELCLVLAVATYFYGLDGLHIPKNGDENAYIHITRLTAASGHLLPLKSQLHEMRNTKPPMLFWQGIASTDWGKNWHLWTLRYPSVVYTLFTTALIFALGWRLSGELETGMLAGLIFLSFFNSYRYGRPFLTDAPEIFWTFLPFFSLLFWESAFESSVVAPVLLGLGLGIGLLYKSFALVIPVTLALCWWHVHRRRYRTREFLRKDAGKIALMAATSLAVFGVWFLLDPNPGAIMREFVLGENVAKFGSHGAGYFAKLLWGGSSIWALALSYPVNAGLLAFPVLGLGWIAYKRRHELREVEVLLWIWVITLFVIFSLPSVRSGRYLLPAMPALAVLCALNWERISRKLFVASLLAAGVVIAAISYLSLRLQFNFAADGVYPPTYWLLLSGATVLVFLVLFVAEFTRVGLPGAALLTSLCLAAFVHPFDGRLGHYSADVQESLQGKQVWVPCDFRAVDESYRFLLPGADIHGYREDAAATVQALASRYALFAVRFPLDARNTMGLKRIGERLELRSRMNSQEVLDMLRGNVFGELFVQEMLLEVPGAQPVAFPSDEGCR